MMRRLTRILIAIVALAAAAYFWAFKSGRMDMSPATFAVLVGAVCFLVAIEMGWTILAFARGDDRSATAWGRIVLAFGLLLACGGGFANWLLSLQGFMILTEGEIRPLFQGENLTEFEAGLLSDPAEMDMTLALREVELVSAGPDTFSPKSTVEAVREGGEPAALVLEGHGRARFGSLILHGGAFGYAPRIVILKGEDEVFDRTVPFLTRGSRAAGISFEQVFTVADHDLEITGRILLESLDEAMRGHPTLGLEVKRSGEMLGVGTLLPGHFADLENGFRVGFAGLRKWQEIDISRRNYPGPILVGASIAALGALLWIVAAARKIFR